MVYLADIFFNLSLSFLSGMTSFSLKQSSKLSRSFVKNKQSHLVCSLKSLDMELDFCVKVIDIRPLAPVENSVSLKLMQRKTLDFLINLPDVDLMT